QLQKTKGQACDVAADCQGGACNECATGNCVDGVCCDQTCTGFCQACSAAKKGSGADGTCGNIGSGKDPDTECSAEAQATCGKAGGCNGAGACLLWGMGTPCGNTFCVGNSITGQICNGLGSCQQSPTGVDCTPYVCQASVCAKPCQVDDQCV